MILRNSAEKRLRTRISDLFWSSKISTTSQKLWSSKGCLFLWRHGVNCAGRLFTAPCGTDSAGTLCTCTRFKVWIDNFIAFPHFFRFAFCGFFRPSLTLQGKCPNLEGQVSSTGVFGDLRCEVDIKPIYVLMEEVGEQYDDVNSHQKPGVNA